MNYNVLRQMTDNKIIAFHRSFVELGAGITGALLLSQLCYWSGRGSSRDGFVWKTQEDITEETGLTIKETRTARKKLKELGVLEETYRGVPRKLFFKVNYEALFELLNEQTSEVGANNTCPKGNYVVAERDKQALPKGTSKPCRKGQTNTETTTKTTTEIKHSCANAQENAQKEKPKLTAERFEEFWQAYPIKKGKKRARDIWKRKRLDKRVDELIADVKYRESNDRQWLEGFAPHGSTYLSQETWQDDIEKTNQNNQRGSYEGNTGLSKEPVNECGYTESEWRRMSPAQRSRAELDADFKKAWGDGEGFGDDSPF